MVASSPHTVGLIASSEATPPPFQTSQRGPGQRSSKRQVQEIIQQHPLTASRKLSDALQLLASLLILHLLLGLQGQKNMTLMAVCLCQPQHLETPNDCTTHLTLTQRNRARRSPTPDKANGRPCRQAASSRADLLFPSGDRHGVE